MLKLKLTAQIYVLNTVTNFLFLELFVKDTVEFTMYDFLIYNLQILVNFVLLISKRILKYKSPVHTEKEDTTSTTALPIKFLFNYKLKTVFKLQTTRRVLWTN